jgi:hypothetical protein
MTIRIGSKIQKLDPADLYKLMDGADVAGFETVFSSARIAGGILYVTTTAGVEVEVGSVKDTLALKAGQVPMMGPGGELVYSGVSATEDGLIRIPANTLAFGDPLTLGTATGFALLHNVVTKKSYLLLDGSLDKAVGSGRPNQFYAKEVETFQANTDNSTVLTANPLEYDYTIVNTSVTYTITYTASAPMNNVKIRLVDAASGIPFKYFPSRVAYDDNNISGMNFRAGTNTINMFSDEPSDPSSGMFNVGHGPLTLEAGRRIKVDIKADSVALRGSVAGMPMLTVEIGKASFRGMAYQDELIGPTPGNAVVSVGLDNTGKLAVTHSDGSINLITLPATPTSALVDRIAAVETSLQQQGKDVAKMRTDFGRVDAKVSELGDVYVFDGDVAPVFPAEVASAYFVHLHSTAARAIEMPVPSPAGGSVDGAMLHITNSNAAAPVNVLEAGGFTVDGGSSYQVPTKSFAAFVFSGTNWQMVEVSPLGVQKTPLSAADIANAIDNGPAPNSGAVTDLAPGWWVLPAGNAGVTGRPGGAVGDLDIFRQNTSGGGDSYFGVVMAFGTDTHNKPAMWAQYLRAGKWSPWIKVNRSTDLTAVLADVASLKAGNAALIARVAALETGLGNIYAPNKVAFDDAVNALIDAKIKAGQSDAPKLPTGIPKIYAYYGNSFASDLGQPGVFSSTSGVVHVTRQGTDGTRLFVAVPNNANQAEDVEGISVDDAILAKWQSRDQAYGGVTYRTFYGPGAFYATSNKIQVKFGSED